jgi:hypothetical protein
MASQKLENLIKKRFQLAQESRTIIQQLNGQKSSSKNSLKSESEKWKNSFHWKELSPNSKGPLFESYNFALPKLIPGVEEPLWVTSRREFLKHIPESERNILLTGDPDQEFDPYMYN